MFGSRLFVNYRRADSEASVRALVEALKSRFGASHIFLDTSDIPYGEDFRRVIRKRIAGSDVVLVVIGQHWLSVANERGPRLQQSDDPVRFEIETALARRGCASCRYGSTARRRRRNPRCRLRSAHLPRSIWRSCVTRRSTSTSTRWSSSYMDACRVKSYASSICGIASRPLQPHGRSQRSLSRLRRFSPFGPAALDVLHSTPMCSAFCLLPGPNSGDPLLLVGIDAASERALGRAFGPSEMQLHGGATMRV